MSSTCSPEKDKRMQKEGGKKDTKKEGGGTILLASQGKIKLSVCFLKDRNCWERRIVIQTSVSAPRCAP
jgi:hypothetical protein